MEDGTIRWVGGLVAFGVVCGLLSGATGSEPSTRIPKRENPAAIAIPVTTSGPDPVEKVHALPSPLPETRDAIEKDETRRDLFQFLFRSFRNRSDYAAHMDGVREWANRRYPETDAHRLVAEYGRYLECEMEVARVVMGTAPPDTADALSARLDEIWEMRQDHLGNALATELFGEEYRASHYRLERRRIVLDATATAEEKQDRLAGLDARWGKGEPPGPKSPHDRYRERMAIHKLEIAATETQEERLALLHELRSSCFPEEVVSRMDAADRQILETLSREAALKEAEQEIRKDPDLDSEKRARQLEAIQRETLGEDGAEHWNRRNRMEEMRNAFIERARADRRAPETPGTS